MTTRSIRNLSQFRIEGLHAAVEELVSRTSHYAPDLSVAATLADVAIATDTGTAVTLSNACRTAYIAHVASTAAHAEADATNTVGAASTDEDSAITLINDIKAKRNLHVQSTTYHRVKRVEVTLVDASNGATLYALCHEMQRVLVDDLRDGAQTLSLVAS